MRVIVELVLAVAAARLLVVVGGLVAATVKVAASGIVVAVAPWAAHWELLRVRESTDRETAGCDGERRSSAAYGSPAMPLMLKPV
jgi:hypothetical protein